MTRLAVFAVLALLGSPAQSQFFAFGSNQEEDALPAYSPSQELRALMRDMQFAELSILCASAWGGQTIKGQIGFDDVSFFQLRRFVSEARKPGFELPEEAYGLREYLITAIAAPSNDVAVGILYAEIGSEANNVVGAHREALSAVKISETYQYELKRLELARLYRCEELEPVFREIKRKKND